MQSVNCLHANWPLTQLFKTDINCLNQTADGAFRSWSEKCIQENSAYKGPYVLKEKWKTK